MKQQHTPILLGIVRNPVQLAGTKLRLEKHQLVVLTPATNVPPFSGAMFARPFGGIWPDNRHRDEEDTILLHSGDFIQVTDQQAESYSRVLIHQGEGNFELAYQEFPYRDGDVGPIIMKFKHIVIGIEPDGYAHS